MENSPETAMVHVPHGSPSEKERALGAIAYIGPLFIASYIFGTESKFVKFHAAQGMVFFIAAIVIRLVLGTLFIGAAVSSGGMNAMMFGGSSLMMLVQLLLLMIAIVAMIKAAKGEEWEMPVVGPLAKKLKM